MKMKTSFTFVPRNNGGGVSQSYKKPTSSVRNKDSLRVLIARCLPKRTGRIWSRDNPICDARHYTDIITV